MRSCAAAASRVCQLTGKKANNGYVVTFSHKRNKKLQGVNLQYKRLYWPEAQRFVRLRLSTKVLCCSVEQLHFLSFHKGSCVYKRTCAVIAVMCAPLGLHAAGSPFDEHAHNT